LAVSWFWKLALSAFDDKHKPPQNDDLAVALRSTLVFWKELKRLIALRFAPVSNEWGFTSKKTAWGLRLKGERRTILYMIPCNGHFLVSFALGEKAVKAAHESDLPISVLKVIDSARKYAEGRGRLQCGKACCNQDGELTITCLSIGWFVGRNFASSL